VGAYCGVVVPRPGKRGERRGRGVMGAGTGLWGKLSIIRYPSDIEDNRVKRVPLLQTEPEFTLSEHLTRKEGRSPSP